MKSIRNNVVLWVMSKDVKALNNLIIKIMNEK